MTPNRRTLAACASACSLVVLTATGAVACGGDDGDPAAPAGGDTAAPPSPGGVPAPPPPEAPTPVGLRVWFKLDPRLTGGLYMGERWVSPPTFEAATQTGASFTVEARADGTPGSSGATWTPSEPDMVSVSPASGPEVLITVHRAGRSTLAVSDGTTAVSLIVEAVHDGGAWRVQFSR